MNVACGIKFNYPEYSNQKIIHIAHSACHTIFLSLFLSLCLRVHAHSIRCNIVAHRHRRCRRRHYCDRNLSHEQNPNVAPRQCNAMRDATRTCATTHRVVCEISTLLYGHPQTARMQSETDRHSHERTPNTMTRTRHLHIVVGSRVVVHNHQPRTQTHKHTSTQTYKHIERENVCARSRTFAHATTTSVGRNGGDALVASLVASVVYARLYMHPASEQTDRVQTHPPAYTDRHPFRHALQSQTSVGACINAYACRACSSLCVYVRVMHFPGFQVPVSGLLSHARAHTPLVLFVCVHA